MALSFVLGGCFALNEYALRGKVKTLEKFISDGNFGLKQSYGFKIKCKGILGKECGVRNLIFLDTLRFENVKITFSSLSTTRIVMKFNASDVKEFNVNKILLPNNVEYTFDLKKENSKLGYINVSRTLNIEFSDFNLFLNLDVIVRSNSLRNVNILYTLNNHLTLGEPYEYSVDSFSVNVIMKNKISNANKLIIINKLKEIIKNTEHDTYFNKNLKIFSKNISLILDSKINNLSMIIARKNNDLKYFYPTMKDKNNKLNNMLEIKRILSSLNESYSMVMNFDKIYSK